MAAVPMDAEELKRRVHLPKLVRALGVPFGPDGKAKCLNPAHDDQSPSMGFFPRGKPPVGCWQMMCKSCGYLGDAFDALELLRGLPWGEAMVELWNLASDPAFTAATGSATVRAREDVEREARAAVRRRRAATALLRRLVADKELPLDPVWLCRTFHIGAVNATTLMIPHLRRPAGPVGGASTVSKPTLVAGRTRTRQPDGSWDKRSLLGSSYTACLYLDSRDSGDRPVILCEGESDAWCLTAWCGDRWNVLGLPGAATRPSAHLLARFSGRSVVVMLDADSAGRAGADRWATALRAGRDAGDAPGVGVRPAAGVSVARLPDGLDACAATRRGVLRALREASK